MRAPTVHLNGTSKEELYRQLGEAVSKSRDLLLALAQAVPSARDYYVQGDRAHTEALQEHNRRMKRVEGVMQELSEMQEKVYEQGRPLKTT